MDDIAAQLENAVKKFKRDLDAAFEKVKQAINGFLPK